MNKITWILCASTLSLTLGAAAATAAGPAYVIRGPNNYRGCQDRATYTAVHELFDIRGPERASLPELQNSLQLIRSGRCVVFEENEPVVVLERSNGFVRLRRLEPPQPTDKKITYWTCQDALKRK